MPFKDKEKNRIYQLNWQKNKIAKIDETPEARRKRLDQRIVQRRNRVYGKYAEPQRLLREIELVLAYDKNLEEEMSYERKRHRKTKVKIRARKGYKTTVEFYELKRRSLADFAEIKEQNNKSK